MTDPVKNRMSTNENSKVFILQDIPANFNKDFIIDYIESTLDIDVETVQLHPLVPKRAIVFLQQNLEDFSQAEQKIQENCLGSKNIKLLKANWEPSVVVSNLDFQKLSEQFLHLYFESEFADGYEVIDYSDTWPEYKLATVHFNSESIAVVKDILMRSDHVPLPSEDYHITIQPFYSNFHKYITPLAVKKDDIVANNERVKEKENGKEISMEGNSEKESQAEEVSQVDKIEAESSTENDSREEEEEEEEDSEETANDKDKKSVAIKNKGVTKEKRKTNSSSDSNGESSDEESDSVDANMSKSDKYENSFSKKEKKEISSQKEKFPESRFRGRGRGDMTGKEPLRRGSYDNKNERKKDTDKIESETSSGQGQDKASYCTKMSNLQEKQQIRRSNFRGGKIFSTNKPSNRSLNSSDSSSGEESVSQEKDIKNSAKPHNFKGRGGTAFIPSTTRSFSSKSSDNCKSDVSENQSHGEKLPKSFPSSLKSNNFPENKTQFYSQDSLKSFDKVPHIQISNANLIKQYSHERSTFYETQLQYKERHQRELAEKEAKIQELMKQLDNQKEQQQKTFQEKIPVTSWQKELLPHCFGKFTGCQTSYDYHENVAVLDGDSENVKHNQINLLKELNKLKEDRLNLTPVMFSILTKEAGKKYLQRKSELCGAKVFLQDEYLFVAAKDDESLQSTIESLAPEIKYKEVIKLEAKIPHDKLLSEQIKMESKYLVKVSWSDNYSEICIEGVKEDVCESKRNIAALIEEFGFLEKSFNVTGPIAKFIHKFLESEVKHLLIDVEGIDYTCTEAQVSIKFKKDRKTVQLVHRNLTKLKTDVQSKSWDLKSEFKRPEDIMLILRGLSCKKMTQKIEHFEIKNKCIVTTNLPNVNYSIKASKKSKPVHSTTTFKKTKQHSDTEATKPDKLKFTIGSACQLVVKSYGDITKENSDVLVCVLTEAVDLRKTRVGMSFNKACSGLWKVLNSEHDAHPNDPVLTTNGPFPRLKCQAICHVILTTWDPNSSPALLSKSIQLVFSQAIALGAKSISFPVLGCGRALGFPPSDVAQITISSIQSTIQSASSIQRVVLLAPDAELFKEYQQEASKCFQMGLIITKQVVEGPAQGAVGGASPIVDNDTVSDGESEDEELNFDIEHLDVQKKDIAEINIVAKHGLESIWSNLRKEIEKVCLFKDYYNQDISDHWPVKSHNRIIQEAKKLVVFIEKSPNPKTHKPGYCVKGLKKDVEEVKKIIVKEFDEFSRYMPKHRIKSNNAPKRGTVDFINYAAESDELVPSYWKFNSSMINKPSFYTKIKNTLGFGKAEDNSNSYLVDVDSKTKDAIKKLVASTCDQRVGHGQDAQGINYTSIKVVGVKRIENVNLFEIYKMQRQIIFRKMRDKNALCRDIAKLSGSKGRVETSGHLQDFMKEELYYEINESYLFHGTKSLSAICSNGIDPRVSNEGGMFGKGIYTAEMFTKADQYTDSIKRRAPNGTQLTMVLARVLLGNVFLCDDKHPSVQSKQSIKLTRPPCVHCLKDVCNCQNQELYDSVMGDGKWIFREFVVYEQSHCYPEYVIFYQRV